MFSISAAWEALGDGSPEERACFGAVGVRLNDLWLSEGHDPFVGRVRQAPMVSAYHLAEWLIWNWWRLRWEPRSHAVDWGFTHRMASIGSGYVWPNIVIFSDGERIAIVARPSRDQEASGYRYIADAAVVLPSRDFENALDLFVDQVVGQLDTEGIAGSNLQQLRADLRSERRDREVGLARKMEALLGFDPDEAPDGAVDLLIADTMAIGPSAAAELAAEGGGSGRIIHAGDLFALADAEGFQVSANDRFVLREWQPFARAQTPAWFVGQQAARSVREQLRRRDQPIRDRQLTELLAVEPSVLSGRRTAPMSFSIARADRNAVIVLRSRWKTGRRFELARILGDQLVGADDSLLSPVTSSYTYRQKLQRAFAAELLAPFEAVDDLLAGDYSDEQQQDVAEHFQVSPLTIRTLLVNHRRIERDDLDGEVDFAPTRAAS